MAKLNATKFRAKGFRDGGCEVSFISELGRQYDVRFSAAGLSGFISALSDLSKGTDIRVSTRAAPYAQPFYNLPPEVTDTIPPDSMGFGVMLSSDFQSVIPYFVLPAVPKPQEHAFIIPLDDAKKLLRDLSGAIGIAEEHAHQEQKPKN